MSNTQGCIYISCLDSHTNDSLVTVIIAVRLYQNICIDLDLGRGREAYSLEFEFESEATICW